MTLPFFGDYLHAKTRYWLILFKNIDDQHILQSVWKTAFLPTTYKVLFHKSYEPTVYVAFVKIKALLVLNVTPISAKSNDAILQKNLKPTMLGHFRPFPVIFAFWDFTKKTWFFNAENHMGPYTMLSFRGK